MTVFALHHLLERAADRDPEHEALRCAGEVLTYQDLHRRATSVAAALIDAGVERGDRVGLYLPKSLDAVAAIYGVMMAGAAYVPIDPASPVLRAAAIALDCSISALVTTVDRAPAIVDELRDHRLRLLVLVGNDGAPVDIDAPTVIFDEVIRSGAVAPSVPVIDEDLAYLLYTSGTTGTPKGVMLSHRHALTFVDWCAATIGTGPDDRFSNHAPFHFDLSVFDLYVAARGGASISVVPGEWAYFGRDLARFIEGEAITVWYSVPSALMILTRTAQERQTFPSLRAVVFAGEVYPTKHLRALRSVVPDAELWNLYGPTETNVCTYLRVTDLPADDTPIPIGTACENTEVFALTGTGDAAGVGEVGELYVRGSSVMKGYWGAPERSAEVLVHDPRGRSSDLVYRTGDLVRMRPDGDFDFLGRRDHQIKSRGYRIELGDVESALHALEHVEEAVAVAVPHDDWGTAIVAFVITKDGAGSITEIEIKRGVADRLPRYMIPARIEITAELPRTSTGKVDRRAVADEAASKAWSWE